MSLDAALAALMVDTVTLEAFVSRDFYGNATYAAGTSYPARIEGTSKKVFNQRSGEPTVVERVATSRVYIAGAPVINEDWRITFADGRQPLILAVEANGDERGAHHQVVYT